MKQNLLMLLSCLAATLAGHTQATIPERGYVFNDSTVPRIDIIIDQALLDQIKADPSSSIEHPSTFIFTTPTGSETLDSVGFRLRGNTSRYSAKKSFKISFNTFYPGREFHGLEKMNINGEHNDPSVMRAKLCWDMMNFMKVPASRANHVSLYINYVYYGVYLNVEHIDEEFIRSRFGDAYGNLYKCLWPADLVYMGSNPQDYKYENDGRRAYDLHTNTGYEDYRDLVDLITVVNTSEGAGSLCQIFEAFNVSNYLKIVAVDILTGNWDNYSYLKNNFYLYMNPLSRRMEFIPFDMDNTFGVDWFDENWATRDIYNWASDEARPLYSATMGPGEYQDHFSFYMDYLLDNYFNPDSLFPRIDRIHEMIRPLVVNDPFYPLDYGYRIEDFDEAKDLAAGAHVKTGLKPYINARVSSARSQLVAGNLLPMVSEFSWKLSRMDDSLTIRVGVVDDDLENVTLMLAENGSGFEYYQMYDDGTRGDSQAGDGIYSSIVIPSEPAVDYSFFIRITDVAGKVNEHPCTPVEVQIPYHSGSLVINEFMASNDSALDDEYGEFDDWIEIFNTGTGSVWLGNKFLSDDLTDRNKWKLPDQYLGPGEMVLIWADGQDSQGTHHANFKLSGSGEEIGLFDAPSTGFQLLDRVIYSAQTTDRSYARSPDGGIDWIMVDNPTPSGMNQQSNDLTNIQADEALFLYPNPVRGNMIYFNKQASFTLYDSRGMKLLQVSRKAELYIGSLPQGFYLIVTRTGESLKLVRQ